MLNWRPLASVESALYIPGLLIHSLQVGSSISEDQDKREGIVFIGGFLGEEEIKNKITVSVLTSCIKPALLNQSLLNMCTIARGKKPHL